MLKSVSARCDAYSKSSNFRGATNHRSKANDYGHQENVDEITQDLFKLNTVELI